MTHFLHVTKVADDVDDDVEYTIDCVGREGCMYWEECSVEMRGRHPKFGYLTYGCTHKPTEAEVSDGEYTAHDVAHQRIDGMWMTDTGRCAIESTDGGADAAYETAREAGVGTHQVHVSYWGDAIWNVDLIRPGTTTTNTQETTND